mgnify:CR=1 FL=1|jgi:hypothetical protein
MAEEERFAQGKDLKKKKTKKGIDRTEEYLNFKFKNKKDESYNKMEAKDGKKTDFGKLSVKAGIDNNPNPTQADRIAGATMKAKDGARTKVRGVRIANKGFRKAKLS